MRYYAVTEHVGPLSDLFGQEVTIALVRSTGKVSDMDAEMNRISDGRAWCDVMPNGTQLPTRGSIMRVHEHCGDGLLIQDRKIRGRAPHAPYGLMLSVEELLVRARDDVATAKADIKWLERQLADARADAHRWRSRCYPTAADIVQAGVTKESAITWLMTHADASGMTWTYDSLEFTWHEAGSSPGLETAAAIRWASEAMDVDQWDVLAEMASIEAAS